jgi:hypothetical protein
MSKMAHENDATDDTPVFSVNCIDRALLHPPEIKITGLSVENERSPPNAAFDDAPDFGLMMVPSNSSGP